MVSLPTAISPLGGLLLQSQDQRVALAGLLQALPEVPPESRPLLERGLEGLVGLVRGGGTFTVTSQPRLVRFEGPSPVVGLHIPQGPLAGDLFLAGGVADSISLSQDTFSPSGPVFLAVHSLEGPSPKTHWYVRCDCCSPLPDASPDGRTRIVVWRQQSGEELPSFAVTAMSPDVRGPDLFTRVEIDEGILSGMMEVFGARELSSYLDLPVGVFVTSQKTARQSSDMVAKGNLYHALKWGGYLYVGEVLPVTDQEFIAMDRGTPAVLEYLDRILAEVGLRRGPLNHWSPPSSSVYLQTKLVRLLSASPPPYHWRFTKKDAMRLAQELATKHGVNTVQDLLDRYHQLVRAEIQKFEFLQERLWHYGIKVPPPPEAPPALRAVAKSAAG